MVWREDMKTLKADEPFESEYANYSHSTDFNSPRLKPMNVVAVLPKHRYRCYEFYKRLFDFLFPLLALIVLLPLLIVVAVLIWFEDRGPAIYTQKRVGKNGKEFVMYKFRSMCLDADEKLKDLQQLNEKDGPVFKMTDDPRVTRIGRIIRKYSIDELPQLFNILKGEMSIVGPRPPLPNEVKQYSSYQMHRLDVTPGLTCYWQISGRSNINFEKWIELDMRYIRERSIWTDFKIILKTVPAVLFGYGAY